MKAGEVTVLLIAAGLLFVRLGINDLGSADEAVYAQVAHEMAHDGHWLYPTCRGEPYLEKPPLTFWLTAITFRVAGESEFTARLWSAIFGLGIIWGVMRFGRLLFNRGVGFAAGLVLVTTWEFLFNHCARTGDLDSALLFFIVMTVAAAWKFRVRSEPRHLYQIATWLALGVLVKGQVALVPLLWIPIVWWIRPGDIAGGSRAGFRGHLALALLLFLVIAAPWFVLQAAHYGSPYGRYLFRHQLTGYLLGTVENAQATVGYYFKEMIRLDYPWPPIVLLGCLFCFHRRGMADFPQLGAARAWLLAWVGTMVVILAVSKTKMPWYHLPALIPMSLLAGLVLERWWRDPTGEGTMKWHRLWLVLHIGLLFLVTGFFDCLCKWFIAWRQHDRDILGNYAHYFFLDPKQHSFLIAPLVLMTVPIVAACRWVLRKRPDAAIAATRLQVALIGGIAIAGAGLEDFRYVKSEGARDIVQEVVRQDRRWNTKGQIHLFDSRQERAPHYHVLPSVYYYLASERRLNLHLHPADPVAWQRFIDSVSAPTLAIVPVEWLDHTTVNRSRLVLLAKIHPAQLVCLGIVPVSRSPP